MMQCLKVFLVSFFLSASFAYSDTIILNSGEEVNGKILSQDDSMVTVDDGRGYGVTYYSGEIKEIKKDIAPLSSEENQVKQPVQTKTINTVSEVPSNEPRAESYLMKELFDDVNQKTGGKVKEYASDALYLKEQLKESVNKIPSHYQQLLDMMDSKFPGTKKIIIEVWEKTKKFLTTKSTWVIFGIYHVLFTIPFLFIVKRFGANLVFAALPIFNLFVMLKMADKPMSEFIVFFVPGFNIILWFQVWIEILRVIQLSVWWSVLLTIPIINLVTLWLLVFARRK